MDAIDLLLNRNSVARLSAPAPSAEDLETILQAALRAPDHARLRPWRFLAIDGEGRQQLGNLYAEAAQLNSADVSVAQLEKLRQQPLRAPLILVVVASVQDHPKVPRDEQLLSAGCAAHSILLAAQALGYAGIWRTGANAYDRHICRGLGLDESELLVGYLYLGSVDGAYKRLPEECSENYCQQWP